MCVCFLQMSEQVPRWKACPARAAGTTGRSTPAAIATTILNENRADVYDADSCSPSDWSDPGVHATGAAAASSTSTSTASADASVAKRQMCGVHERSSPCVCDSTDPMDAEDWLRMVERELHTAQCNDREKVLYGLHLLRGAA
jgi:hypothetical protein